MRWARALGLAAVVALIVAALASLEPSARAGGRSTAGSPSAITKIKHIVIIMQENRSFDNYFGSYPHANGIPGLAGHPGTLPCVPDAKRHTCWHPFHDRRDFNHGGPHAAPNVGPDVNNGKMNGFVNQMNKVYSHLSSLPPEVMGYHTGADIPNYWKYARNYVLQDRMFEPVASWSLPAHLYLVSMWSAICKKQGDPMSCRSAAAHPAQPPGGPRHSKTPPDYAWTDLTYLLFKHHVSWRYYIFKGIEPDCESNLAATCAPVTQGPRSNPTWNPLHYFDTVKKDHQLGNIQSLNAFFAAANKGTLPAVSWIMPNRNVSEHPGTSLVSRGQTYVTGLIDTIMQSPQWNSTAIFVAWDDWGGLYDNARPPHVDGLGYGLRVPALMISPYARQGFIDHQTLSFDAYAKFIEADFLGGRALNPKSDGRPDPRPDVRESLSILGSLSREFNFKQPPRKPAILPVHPKTDLTH
jgi:phospholipase C